MPSAGPGLVKKRFVQRHKAKSDGPVTCVVAAGQGDEQEGLRDAGELLLWRLKKGNKGRVEKNRTQQWHWDNLWSYLGMFNWPVSFSHFMHFHKDSSLPLILSSCGSLDFPMASLFGFLCFVSCVPPISKQCWVAWLCGVWAEKQIQERGCLGKSHIMLNRGRDLIWEGELLVEQTLSLQWTRTQYKPTFQLCVMLWGI